MRGNFASKSNTLGEVLSSKSSAAEHGLGSLTRVSRILKKLIGFGLLVCTFALALGLLLEWSDIKIDPVLILLCAFVFVWLTAGRKSNVGKQHFLLANDRLGFMRSLRLDEKTVVIDGSNIYHFGHDNGLDAQPLSEIVRQLRSQGYRVICFFDANIYHTLSEHGAIPRRERHSLVLLQQIFGLDVSEIYVVPSGVQADVFILECLKYLPISFAVTNDKYRDYASEYPTVMSENLWRKSVAISDGKIKLLQHKFHG
ncbi:NYN domain-containing protein [Ruegeria conchae]|uniref:Zc3h12a-like ribonuclease protein n=1 Tax=Ruegeria conchae TaxID=981384 RepID=A0A497YUD4_9RHOB|nr:hypothetical protein [Ruegeria conchae]RLJ98971.1 Zc3h12a-like ribonuclease protein [Ruegeria conchae]